MKIAAIIAGALLGLIFIASGLVVLLKLVPMPPPPPADTPAGGFFAAFGPTGYLTFVKVMEVVGGLLVAIPKTRRAGLLVLGPILINILAFHTLVMSGVGLFSPILLAIVAVTLFLVWIERRAFAAFLTAPPAPHIAPVTASRAEPVNEPRY